MKVRDSGLSPFLSINSKTYMYTSYQDIRKEIAASNLNRVFEGVYFDICSIDKMAGRGHMDTEEYPMLRSLHCVNYSQMTDRVRYRLPEMCAKMLAPYIGELRISEEKSRRGIRLFETEYETPMESIQELHIASVPTPEPVPLYKKLLTLQFWRGLLSGFKFSFSFKVKK